MPAGGARAQAVFDETGSLHAAGLKRARAASSTSPKTLGGTTRWTDRRPYADASAPAVEPPAVREQPARSRIVQKESSRVPIVAAISAPSAWRSAREEYGVTLVKFIAARPPPQRYAHAERIEALMQSNVRSATVQACRSPRDACLLHLCVSPFARNSPQARLRLRRDTTGLALAASTLASDASQTHRSTRMRRGVPFDPGCAPHQADRERRFCLTASSWTFARRSRGRSGLNVRAVRLGDGD